jgi:hypothetical protein
MNSLSAAPKVGAPHMSAAEVVVLQDLMRSGVSRYLEFGSGGSTLMAVRAHIKTIVSVESDPQWAAAVRSDPEIAPRIDDCSAVVLHADIGPVGSWGSPVSTASMAKWHNYLRAPWIEWERRGEMPELVLVDGRFRVASCLSVLSGSEDPGPVVVIHDVVPERTSYTAVFDYFDVSHSAESLSVMRPKRELSNLLVFTALLRSQWDGS